MSSLGPKVWAAGFREYGMAAAAGHALNPFLCRPGLQNLSTRTFPLNNSQGIPHPPCHPVWDSNVFTIAGPVASSVEPFWGGGRSRPEVWSAP